MLGVARPHRDCARSYRPVPVFTGLRRLSRFQLHLRAGPTDVSIEMRLSVALWTTVVSKIHPCQPEAKRVQWRGWTFAAFLATGSCREMLLNRKSNLITNGMHAVSCRSEVRSDCSPCSGCTALRMPRAIHAGFRNEAITDWIKFVASIDYCGSRA